MLGVGLNAGWQQVADARTGYISEIHFCTVCGIHTFTRPRAAPELYTVNVRTLDNFDLQREKPELVAFDGRSWEASVGSLKQKHD